MTSFDYRFNLLMAKVEWSLGGESEKIFWKGYVQGLCDYHEKSGKTENNMQNPGATRDETRFFRSGYVKGSEGVSVAEAAAALDKIHSKNFLVA